MARQTLVQLIITASARGVRRAADVGIHALGKLRAAAAATAAGLAALAAGASAKLFSDSVTAAQKLEEQLGKLRAIIKSTGGAAEITAEEIDVFSRELDEATLGSAENIRDAAAALLTFKSISGDVFKDTLRLGLDVSSVFGNDLVSSVTQLGKALENPTQGLSALTRVGITFSEQQKELIKSLQESGKVAEAQRRILQALENQVGGAASGEGKGLSGAIDLLGKRFTDLQEKLGAIVLPTITQYFNELAAAVGQLVREARNLDAEEIKEWADSVRSGLEGLGRTGKAVIATFRLLFNGLTSAYRASAAAIFGILSSVNQGVAFAIQGMVKLGLASEESALAFSERAESLRQKQAELLRDLAVDGEDIKNAWSDLTAVIIRAESGVSALGNTAKEMGAKFQNALILAVAPAEKLEAKIDSVSAAAGILASEFKKAGLTTQAELDAAAQGARNLLDVTAQAGAGAEDLQRAYENYATAARKAYELRSDAEKEALDRQLQELGVALKLVDAFDKQQAAAVNAAQSTAGGAKAASDMAAATDELAEAQGTTNATIAVGSAVLKNLMDLMETARGHLGRLSEAAREAFDVELLKNLGKEMQAFALAADNAKSANEQIADRISVLNSELKDLDFFIQTSISGSLNRFYAEVVRTTLQVEIAFLSQQEAAARYAENIVRDIERGTVSLRQVDAAATAAANGMGLLGEQELAPLNAAIERARDLANDLFGTIRSRIDDIKGEFDRLFLSEAERQKAEFEAEKSELEDLIAQARRQGNEGRTLAKELQDAARQREDIFREEQRRTRQQEAERQRRGPTAQPATAGAPQRQGGGGLVVNINSEVIDGQQLDGFARKIKTHLDRIDRLSA